MKSFAIQFANIALILWGQMDAPSLTLDQVMAAAAQRPQHQAALMESQALRAEASTVDALASRPSVLAELGYQRAEPQQELNTPIGPLSLGAADTRFVTAEITQPLWSPAERRHLSPALRKQAEAQEQQAEALRQQLARIGAEAYLNVLRIDARLRSTRAFINSLSERTKEVEAQVREGRALRADLLKIELNRDDARLAETQLLNQRQVATRDLGRVAGQDGRIEPAESKLPLPEGLTQLSESQALAKRPDLSAIRSQIDALATQRQGVLAERLPRVGLKLRWEALDPAPFVEDDTLTAQLAVSWRPFEGGSRKHRAAALTARRRAAQNQLTEADRGVIVAMEAALATYQTAKFALEVRRKDVTQAEETLRVESSRYREGRATLNDVLEFEALLRERRTLRELAELDLIAAKLDYRLATGQL